MRFCIATETRFTYRRTTIYAKHRCRSKHSHLSQRRYDRIFTKSAVLILVTVYKYLCFWFSWTGPNISCPVNYNKIGYNFIHKKPDSEPIFNNVSLQQYILLCSQVVPCSFFFLGKSLTKERMKARPRTICLRLFSLKGIKCYINQ